MRNFLAAIQFITILPVGKTRDFKPQQIATYFPFVGLLLGGAVCSLDWLALKVYPELTVAVIDTVFFIVLTGAFHLDGLADSADGFFSHKGKDEILKIMKDSRIGVMGATAVICLFSLKCSGILSLQEHRTMVIFLVPGYSRFGMLLGMRVLPYGRPEGGTGSKFFDSQASWKLFCSFPLLFGLSLFLGWGALVLIFGFAVCTWLIIVFYKKMIACITGDTLGAMNELLEASLFMLLGGIF